jgi:rhodanese-related sulfurtransferase
VLEFWVDPESPYHKPQFAEDKRFVLFCAVGWRSALATRTMQEMGLERVAHIDGGFTAWKASGGPVEQKPPARPAQAPKSAKPAGAAKPTTRPKNR